MADAPTCSRCSQDVLDGDLVVYRHGDFFHVRCWQVSQSREHIEDSKRIAQRAGEQLTRSKEHLARSHRTVADFLCVRCGTLIAPDDRVDTATGPAHRRCDTEGGASGDGSS